MNNIRNRYTLTQLKDTIKVKSFNKWSKQFELKIRKPPPDVFEIEYIEAVFDSVIDVVLSIVGPNANVGVEVSSPQLNSKLLALFFSLLFQLRL